MMFQDFHAAGLPARKYRTRTGLSSPSEAFNASRSLSDISPDEAKIESGPPGARLISKYTVNVIPRNTGIA